MLTCSLNSLMKLDLTGCTALESLDCSDNALAALDLVAGLCTLGWPRAELASGKR